jgi:hypothetical protein
MLRPMPNSQLPSVRIVITRRTTLPWLRAQVQRRLDEQVDFVILGQGERARKLLIRLRAEFPTLLVSDGGYRMVDDGDRLRQWRAFVPLPGSAFANWHPDRSMPVRA